MQSRTHNKTQTQSGLVLKEALVHGKPHLYDLFSSLTSNCAVQIPGYGLWKPFLCWDIYSAEMADYRTLRSKAHIEHNSSLKSTADPF